jgi:DNA-binding IclR family transcriptional regulator
MSEPIRAVDRALDILLIFTQERRALSLTEISEGVGMSKSTVHRLLATLEAKRFLIRNENTGKYQLGYRFLEMASQVMGDENQQWALPYLEGLVKECGETVDLAVMDGDHVVYLQVVESPQRVKLAAAKGLRLPAFCTATGKAFLAYLPDEQVKAILSKGLFRFTENTHTLPADIYEDLRETHRRGYAVSNQEYEKDINAIAAPILGADGRPILVIAIAGPSFRLPPERMAELGQAILATNEKIQREVGLVALSAMIPRSRS